MIHSHFLSQEFTVLGKKEYEDGATYGDVDALLRFLVLQMDLFFGLLALVLDKESGGSVHALGVIVFEFFLLAKVPSQVHSDIVNGALFVVKTIIGKKLLDALVVQKAVAKIVTGSLTHDLILMYCLKPPIDNVR